jgi:mediator of replication checkpoint protein 1
MHPQKGGFDAFRGGDDEFGLSLSFDANLQPALEVSSTALRRADDIFQNEQEIILQAAQDTTKPKKPQLYIDENGYVLSYNVSLRALNTFRAIDSSPKVDRPVQIPRSITRPHKRHR